MKRWLVLALSVVMVIGCSVTAYAEKKPSITGGARTVKLPQEEDLHPNAGDVRIFDSRSLAEQAEQEGNPADILYYWEWTTGTQRAYYPDVPDRVYEDIMKINAGEMGVEELSSQFAGYGLLAQIGDLHLRRYNDGSYHHGYVYGQNTGNLTNVIPFNVLEATWEVGAVPSGADICVIHYSNTNNKWEIIEPLELSVTNNTVRAVFTDLSPIGIIYRLDSVPGDSSGSGSGSGSSGGSGSSSGQSSSSASGGGTMYVSPKTGQGYGAELMLLLGVCCLGAAGYQGIKLQRSKTGNRK